MTTFSPPTNGHASHKNGHARFADADFSAKELGGDLSGDGPVADPLADDLSPIAAKKQAGIARRERSVFEELLRSAPATKRPLPEFPTQVLPPPIRAWVEAQARATQTPSDVAAMLALAASSAALAKKVWVDGGGERAEPLHLFVGAMLDPAARGGEVLAAALRPLRDQEFEEVETDERDAALDRIYQEKLREDLARWKEEFFRDGDEAKMRKLVDAEMHSSAGRPRRAPRRIIEQVDARSLHRHLGEQGRISCFSAEGEIFRQLAGRATPARDRLMHVLRVGHSAGDLLAEMPRGRVVAVRRASVTCASLFSPLLAAAIGAQRTCPERGLLSRFLYCAPAAQEAPREAVPPLVPDDVAAKYRAGIRRLATGLGGFFLLSPEAQRLQQEWQREIEAQSRDGAALAPIHDWARNLPNTTLRLAGILHAWMADVRTPISGDTLAAAIAIGRYLLPHAAQVLEILRAADDDCSHDERSLLRFARDAREFSAREALRHLRKTMLHSTAIDRALAGLVRRGYLRFFEDEGDGPGRPAGLRFALLPLAIDWEKGETRDASRESDESSCEGILSIMDRSAENARSCQNSDVVKREPDLPGAT